MKGIVFNLLADLVEEQFGLDVWDDLIESTAPLSNGIYTSVELYPDDELMAYVDAIANHTGASKPDVIRLFGSYMLGRFAELHPEFFAGHTIKSFLQSVHDVIHVEVEKLHPDALLPDFTYEDPGADGLIMHYQSPRKLCHLAEGLIDGCSKHFGIAVQQRHDSCMHDGAAACRLELSFEA
ncbi:MAG: heme NO-binding domain-containing protein [Pseudomonadota bacterium]